MAQPDGVTRKSLKAAAQKVMAQVAFANRWMLGTGGALPCPRTGMPRHAPNALCHHAPTPKPVQCRPPRPFAYSPPPRPCHHKPRCSSSPPTQRCALAPPHTNSFTTLRDRMGGNIIKPSELINISLLGEGAFASVFKAYYTPSDPPGAARQVVAVKRLKPTVFEDPTDFDLFCKEVALMRKLKHK